MHRILTAPLAAPKSPYSLELVKAQRAPFFLAATCGIALLGGALFVPTHADESDGAPQLTQAANAAGSRITDATTERKPRVLLAQAASNNQTNKPAASPDSKTEPNGLKVPVGPDKSSDLPQPKPPVGDGSRPTGPGGSSLPQLGGAATGPVVPAVTQGGPSAETIAAAEGREVAQVRVVGLRVIPEESVLLQATNTRRGAAFAARQAELDRSKIAAMGFFASVQYQVTPNLEDAAKVDVAFVVAENRAVTGFVINGSSSVKTEDLLKVVQTKTGTVLNSNTLNEDVGRIQELYRQRGFASLVTEVKQQEDGKVSLTIQEAKVSKVAISGLKKTRESLLRRLIRTKNGDSFDQKRLQLDLNRLYDTGFFDDVTFKLDDDPDKPGFLVVTIGVKEKRTGTFTLGVGFDSRSKLSGFVTLSENNFRGTGKRVSGSVEIGSVRTFDIGYGNPFIGDKNASYNASIYSRRIFREPRSVNLITGLPDSDFYEEHRTGGRLDYTMPLDYDRNTSVIFGFRGEKARLFKTDLNGTITSLPGVASGRITAPSIGYISDKRDLRLDPSRGTRMQFVVEKAFKFLGGDTDFTKFDVDLRHYLPLMKGTKANAQPKLVLAGRLVIGKSLGQLPAFEQYFVGGSDTVRGYDTDEQFGDNQFFGNVELRYRLQRKFQVVGFVDAGKASGGLFSSSNTVGNSTGMLVGIGAGIRVQTPIGPIRLDLGKGKNGGVRTHFGIGASF